ncbi:DUF397 domain-containing protein [Streptomyces sp. NPDC002677]|uniref:DUF397 domain-containing protein n=1 Tax=Streptomyces sp. NPDC002677 TaxID=3154774 RepID=UPI00332455ED
MKPRRQGSWRKSSHSNEVAGCVEVLASFRIQVRDSKFTELGHISFDASAWTVFVTSMSIPPIPRG